MTKEARMLELIWHSGFVILSSFVLRHSSLSLGSSLLTSPSCLDKRFKIADRRALIDAVIEVEDVPPAAAGQEARLRGLDHFLARAVAQDALIDVSLEDPVGIHLPR